VPLRLVQELLLGVLVLLQKRNMNHKI